MEWLERTIHLKSSFPFQKSKRALVLCGKQKGSCQDLPFPSFFLSWKVTGSNPVLWKKQEITWAYSGFTWPRSPWQGNFHWRLPVYLGREVDRNVVLLLCGQRRKDTLLSELFKTFFLLAAGPWNRGPQVWISKGRKNPTHFPQAKALHSRKCSLSLPTVWRKSEPLHQKSIFSWNRELYWQSLNGFFFFIFLSLNLLFLPWNSTTDCIPTDSGDIK